MRGELQISPSRVSDFKIAFIIRLRACSAWQETWARDLAK